MKQIITLILTLESGADHYALHHLTQYNMAARLKGRESITIWDEA